MGLLHMPEAVPPRPSPPAGHVPGEIRIGSPNKGYDQSLILDDQPKFGPRKIARMLLDVLLALSLPALLMLVFGIWQMAEPDKVHSSDTPTAYKLEYKKLTLRTQDGYDIAAWDVAPSKPSDDAVLVLSGYAADKGSILPRTAFLGQEHRLLYIDFRSFGESKGWYSTMGLREVEDALAGIRYLKEQGVKKIGIYGFTMGGAVALEAAAREPAVAAVVTEDAYSDFDALVAQPYGYLGPAKKIFGSAAKATIQTVLRTRFDAASPAAVASSITVPVLVIHSRADVSVPFHHADVLKERMGNNANVQFWFTEGKTDLESRTAFAQKLLDFFGANLAGVAPGNQPVSP